MCTICIRINLTSSPPPSPHLLAFRSYIGPPDARARAKLIMTLLHSNPQGAKLGKSELDSLVARTEGYSNSDLTTLCQVRTRRAASASFLTCRLTVMLLFAPTLIYYFVSLFLFPFFSPPPFSPSPQEASLEPLRRLGSRVLEQAGPVSIPPITIEDFNVRDLDYDSLCVDDLCVLLRTLSHSEPHNILFLTLLITLFIGCVCAGSAADNQARGPGVETQRVHKVAPATADVTSPAHHSAGHYWDHRLTKKAILFDFRLYS